MASEPEKLENMEYLQSVNSELMGYSSYLIVRKNGETIYSGKPESEEDYLDEAYLELDIEEGNIYVPDPVPYHLTRWDLLSLMAAAAGYVL